MCMSQLLQNTRTHSNIYVVSHAFGLVTQCEFFADFLSFMPNKAKISLFYRIFQFLTLFGMKFKKSAKMRKRNI